VSDPTVQEDALNKVTDKYSFKVSLSNNGTIMWYYIIVIV